MNKTIVRIKQAIRNRNKIKWYRQRYNQRRWNYWNNIASKLYLGVDSKGLEYKKFSYEEMQEVPWPK